MFCFLGQTLRFFIGTVCGYGGIGGGGGGGGGGGAALTGLSVSEQDSGD